MPRSALAGHLSMLVFSALVAGSFALGVRVANELSPMALNAVRFWIALGIVGGITCLRGGFTRKDFQAPWRYLVLGGAFAFYFVLMFEGLKTAPSVSAAAVFTLTPILSAGFAYLLLRQRMTRRIALALMIGGVGALWVIFRADIGALLAFEIGRGEAIYFVGVISHAIYTPLVRKLNRGESVWVFTSGTLLAGSVLLTFIAWPDIVSTSWQSLRPLVWVTVLYVAVFASAATFVLLQFATLQLPSSKVMAYTYLVPSWVMLWDLALGGRLPPLGVVTGCGLTIVALMLLLRDEESHP